MTEVTNTVIKKITWEWTSEAGYLAGTVVKQTDYYYSGEVIHLVTVPDSTDAPDASYDVQVLDSDSVDVLANAGANRSASATEHIQAASLGIVVNSKLTLSITNAGSANKGKVYLYIR